MQKPIEIKREIPKMPQEDQVKFRLIAREILSDVEHLFAQHLLLTRMEIERSMRFVKASFAMGFASLILGVAAVLSLIRALAYSLGQSFDWTPATTELVHGVLQLILLGITFWIARNALAKLKDLPYKLSKQWKEEWQWLRKNL